MQILIENLLMIFKETHLTDKAVARRKSIGFKSGECGGQSRNLLLYSAVFRKTLISHIVFTSSNKTWIGTRYQKRCFI